MKSKRNKGYHPFAHVDPSITLGFSRLGERGVMSREQNKGDIQACNREELGMTMRQRRHQVP